MKLYNCMTVKSANISITVQVHFGVAEMFFSITMQQRDERPDNGFVSSYLSWLVVYWQHISPSRYLS